MIIFAHINQKVNSMKKYLGIKVVSAKPMTRDEAGKAGLIRGYSENDENCYGYKVVYEDGYESWSPKTTFEKAYKEIDSLTFGEAIEALKNGKKVTRKGWNGKGMFLWLKPAANIKAEWCKDEALKELVNQNGGEILGLGTICMYTHDSTGRKAILTGWLASQSDMLSEDWEVI
jgi:hypothetical protein